MEQDVRKGSDLRARKNSVLLMTGAAALSGGVCVCVAPTLAAKSAKAHPAKRAATSPKATPAAHTKPAAIKKAAAAGPSPVVVLAGKKVYDGAGCANCHSIAGNGGSSGPDLSGTGADATHTVQWFQDQVSNPKTHNPNSTMPGFAATVKGKDLVAVATFLTTLKPAAQASVAPRVVSKPVPKPSPVLVAEVEKNGGVVEPLAQNDNHLDVSFHMAGSAVTDASLAPLKKLKNVVHLDLGKTAVTDSGLTVLQSMPDLTELHLEQTGITDKGLAHVKNLHDLTYLNLYGSSVTDAGLASLSHLTNLRHLYVWQTKATAGGADALRKALPQLQIVMGDDLSTPTPAAADTTAKAPTDPVILAGQQIYAANGCANCHSINRKGGDAGPDLTRTGADPTHTADWFQVQVTNPKAHHPNGKMPAFANVKGADLDSLAKYLVSLKVPE